MNRSFVILLAAVVIVGLGLGGAFAGGVAVGQRKVETTPTPSSSIQSVLEQLQQGTPLAGMGQRLRQGTPVAGTPVPGMFGLEGVLGGMTGMGVVQSVEGSTINLTDRTGSTKVSVDKATTISRSAEGQLSDVKAGDQVLIFGKRNDDGTISATSIMIIPATR